MELSTVSFQQLSLIILVPLLKTNDESYFTMVDIHQNADNGDVP
jgi:hypothetical protein